MLLFPDGGCRRAGGGRCYGRYSSSWQARCGAAAGRHDITGGLTNALDAAGVSFPNPLGFLPRHGWFSGLIAVIVGLALISGVLSVASVFVRRRGASAELRMHLAWLGYVG